MLRRVADRLLEGAAAAVDRAATMAVESRANRSGSALAISHSGRLAFYRRVAQEYPAGAALDFHTEVGGISPALRRVRGDRGSSVFDATWPSAYLPYCAGIRARYEECTQNRLAVARLFVRERPRPMVVIIHGYLAGHFAIEERLWPLAEFDRLGFDVALFVLPFHALRARGDLALPEFPSADPRMTIEGFRQAVADLRGLCRWLRQRGHARLGLVGMSLGGYTAALTATVESDLDFLVPLVPLACLADFAREQGRLSPHPHEAELEHSLLAQTYRVTSPLALPPQIPSSRVFVVGARADRVTPVAHARKLATHFSAPLLAWRGGHLLQVGRSEMFRRVFDHLTNSIR